MLSRDETLLELSTTMAAFEAAFDIRCTPGELNCTDNNDWTSAASTSIWNYTTNPGAREFNDLNDPCSMFRFVLNAIVIGLVCILGIVGNTVSMFVLQRDRHNRVAVFLLQSLAVADNLNLCMCFLFVTVLYGFLPTINPAAMKQALVYIVMYGNMVGYAAQSGVIWVTVLLGINRYVAICVPYQAKRWLTLRAARIQVALVAIVSVLLNVPRLFQHDIKTKVTDNGETEYELYFTEFGRTSSFSMFYLNIFYTSIILILPLVLLVVFNACIIRQLQRSKKRMIRDSLSYSGKQENNITVVMVIIVLELVLCHTPDRIIQIYRVIHYGEAVVPHCPEDIFYAYNISNLIVILSSSTDFIIYYVFRERFRTILCNRLCSVHHVGKAQISLLPESMMEPVLESPGPAPQENYDDLCPALSNL